MRSAQTKSKGRKRPQSPAAMNESRVNLVDLLFIQENFAVRISIAGHGDCSDAGILLAVLPAELNELRRGVGLFEDRLHIEFAHRRLLFLGRLRQAALLAAAGGV